MESDITLARVTLMAASDRAPDSLLLTLPEFRLHPDEPLGQGLKRLAVGTLETSVSGFYDGEAAFPDAVHTARKSTKRLRSLLRLIRYEIGEKVYKYENNLLKDTARLLSDVRSATVVAMALEEMRQLYGSVLAQGALEEPAQRLAYRRDRAELRTMEDPEVVPTVVARLEQAHARYQTWPVGDEARRIYGVGVRNTFEAIETGLKTTYGRGRMEMVRAYSNPAASNFHAWRKRVKYLRHQVEVLTPLWPEVIVGLGKTTEHVGDLLGTDHDLHELVELISTKPDLCPDPVERTLIIALAEQLRIDLQTAARILGRRVYAETPVSLTTRFSTYWDTAGEARALADGFGVL